MALTSSITLAGVGFASALKIGVDQKIHGVELVAFAAHVHGGSFARGGDGSEIRVDIVLPQADAGKMCEGICKACGAAGAICA